MPGVSASWTRSKGVTARRVTGRPTSRGVPSVDATKLARRGVRVLCGSRGGPSLRSELELVDPNLSIVTISGRNCLSVEFRAPTGPYEPAPRAQDFNEEPFHRIRRLPSSLNKEARDMRASWRVSGTWSPPSRFLVATRLTIDRAGREYFRSAGNMDTESSSPGGLRWPVGPSTPQRWMPPHPGERGEA